MQPSHPGLEPLLQEGVRALEREPSLAARKAREILQAAPHHLRGALLLGVAHRKMGDAAGSLRVLERLAQSRPDWAPAQYELGITLGMAGRSRDALVALSRAARIKPDIGEVWKLIADLLSALGDPAGADLAYANHTAISTAAREPGLREAAVAMCANRPDDADRLLAEHLEAHPADAAAMRIRAEVLARLGRHEDAERWLARCLETAPDFVAARYQRAVALANLGRTTEALAELDRLLAIEPRHPAHLNLRATARMTVGDFDGAIDDFSVLLATRPLDARAWLAYGHALRTSGRRDESVAAYRRSIELAPSQGEAYWSLANLKTFRFDVVDIQAMRTQVERIDLGVEDRVHFHFALGKALEDEEDYERSFAQYAAGNRLRRTNLRYDPDETHRFVERSKAVFTREFFANRSGAGCADDAPIFIIGMPRSGSTLVEQILSSHSRIEGTMELRGMEAIGRSVVGGPSNRLRLPFPDVLQAVDPAAFVELGERYLAQARVHRRSGAPHFVDKWPTNWQYAGLILLILPNARIIDARRHPLSCGFSIFKQLFARGQQRFSYSLEDIGRYYLDYVDLMAHFDAVLPGRVHRVVYEQLIEDTEAEVTRLLDYCGLPFEQSCLRFYETERAVFTPSSEQVRRPIFREGVEGWKNYRPWLGPLAAVFETAGVVLPP